MDIIAIDDHEDVINQYESMITTGIVGDITEMDLLDAADIGNCDTVVICDGRKLWNQVSLAVMHCKALGVEHVIAKVKNEVTKEVLEKIGADLVILPEVEAGMSLAKMILFQHGLKSSSWMKQWWWLSLRFQLAGWKNLQDLAVREEYHLNIIGYRDAEDQPLHIQIGPDFIWPEGVRVMAVTDNQYLDRIQDLLD